MCQSEWGILSRQFSCPEATARYTSDIPGQVFCLSTGWCPGPSSTRHCLFPGAKETPDFIPPTLWPPKSPDLNPVDYSIWNVLQEKVYRFRIANVDELKTRLIDEWARFDQSIVDAAIGQTAASPSKRLVRVSGAHFEHQF